MPPLWVIEAFSLEEPASEMAHWPFQENIYVHTFLTSISNGALWLVSGYRDKSTVPVNVNICSYGIFDGIGVWLI